MANKKKDESSNSAKAHDLPIQLDLPPRSEHNRWGETMEEIKRLIFEVALSPEELERLKAIQEAIREGDILNRIPGRAPNEKV